MQNFASTLPDDAQFNYKCDMVCFLWNLYQILKLIVLISLVLFKAKNK